MTPEALAVLHTQLLKLINSREMWAFVGSGPSIDAGCPSWRQLLDAVVETLDTGETDRIQEDRFFADSLDKGDLPAAFGVIETVIGRDRLDGEARAALATTGSPGAMHRLLAELPFAGYITTNYDPLLEKALNQIEPGWSPVGNMGDEVRKASGSARRVVWHVHGASDLPISKSRLVLTQEDYDQIYLDGSEIHTQLRGLLAHRRVLMIGFGFRDLDVMQLLRRVGRLTDPDRPIYAFAEKAGELRHQNGRDVFLRQHKIDAQTYPNADGSHRNLRSILSVYASLSLRRSLSLDPPMWAVG